MISGKDSILKTLSFIKGTNRKSTKQLVESLIDLKAQIKMMEDRGYPSDQIFKIQQAALQAIKLDLFENNKQELLDFQKQKEELRAAYKNQYDSNYLNHEREIATYKRKYASMSLKELSAEALKYIEGKYPEDIDPAIVEELAIQLKQNNYPQTEFELFKKKMNDYCYDSPHLKNDLGKYLDTNENVLTQNLTNVLYERDDATVFPVTPEDILEYFDIESEGADNV